MSSLGKNWSRAAVACPRPEHAGSGVRFDGHYGLLCVRAGVRQVGALRRSWWLLGAACAAWTLGEVIWAVHDLVLQDAVAVPSWADLGYLSAIPLAVAALLSHPTMAGSAAHRARYTLDGLLVATALLFVSWTFLTGVL